MRSFLRVCSSLVAFVVGCYSVNAQIITTAAGTGMAGYSGDGGPATAARFSNAPRIGVDNCGNVYIGDGGNNRIRKVDALTGIMTTVAGNGVAGFSGDGGPATAASLRVPSCPMFDKYGNLYIGDGLNNRIRKVDITTGIITTYVGTGTVGFSGDGGPATAANIYLGDFAIDTFGNLYMCDNYRIRKIDAAGIITTIAGDGLQGPTVLGVPATATHVHPYPAIVTDLTGNIYTVDSPGVILKINASTGILSKVAGSGISTIPYTGDGIPATACNMNPAGIYVDDTGAIYAAGVMNNICIMIDTFGYTHTIAGNGVSGFSGDGGPATSAKLYYPKNIKLDRFGHTYIADWTNYRIRKVTYPYTLTSPIITLGGVPVAPIGISVTVTATIGGVGSSYIIHWMNHGIEFAATTIPSVTYTKSAGIDTITARIVSCGFYDSTTSFGHIVSSETPSSILANSVSGGVYVYPNPANKKLHIEYVQPRTTYQLSTIVGAVAQSGSLKQSSNTINIKHQPPGIYLLVLTDEEGRRTVHKIVKE